MSDRVALAMTRLSCWFADRLFGARYAHRAVVLETVAAVPGMVGATLQHLSALRHLTDDAGRVQLLEEEAANERMHLNTFLEVAQPTRFERTLILVAQGVFFNLYFLLYLLSPRTAHRMVGYFEEEAVVSYTCFLAAIDDGRIANTPAPKAAIAYWRLRPDARLRDVVVSVRADEMGHRDVNHRMADQFCQAEASASPNGHSQSHRRGWQIGLMRSAAVRWLRQPLRLAFARQITLEPARIVTLI